MAFSGCSVNCVCVRNRENRIENSRGGKTIFFTIRRTKREHATMPLFPLSPSPAAETPPLVGLAKVAAGSPLAGEKLKVQYYHLASRTVLNRCASGRVPDRKSTRLNSSH